MPVLTILGMPSNLATKLPQLRYDLQSSVASDLELASLDGVSVFFPADLDQDGLGEELICLVDGMFVKPECTPKVRQKTLNWIRTILLQFAKHCLPQCSRVEVIPSRYDQDVDGFAAWKRKKSD